MKLVKFILGAAAWSAIAVLIMKSLAPHLWWIGLIAGVFCGYMSMEYKTVIAAVKTSWSVVIGYRPDKEMWRYRWMIIRGTISISMTISVIIFLIVTIMELPISRHGLINDHSKTSYILGLGLCFLFSFYSLSIDLLEQNKERLKNGALRIEEGRKQYNPFSFFGYRFPVAIFKGVVWLVKHKMLVPEIAKGFVRIQIGILKGVGKIFFMLGKFVWRVIVIIHSDRRLLYAICIAGGALTGHSYENNALVGGLAGGFYAFVSYELIAVKLLRIVPNGANKSS